jgi:2-isopropylmalate synthase
MKPPKPSFDLLVHRIAGSFKPHFETVKYRIVAGDRDAARNFAFAEAILKIRVGPEMRFEAAEGHGPVERASMPLYANACWNSIPNWSTCISSTIPRSGRVVNCEAGTAARIRVNIGEPQPTG